MQSQWQEQEAARYVSDPVALCAYSSRLLGLEPALVQHGGGNTSVKLTRANLFGESEKLLFVKGSGWDLATIQSQGFAPVKMKTLMQMARLEKLSDADMVRELRSAMTDPFAPTPSVEAILHAIIPTGFVFHTHSDAVVTLTNTPDGQAKAKELFGSRVLLVPYVMPGFVLSRQMFTLTQDLNWADCDAIVLLNHGVFTFHDDAQTAYENMIQIVSKAESYLAKKNALEVCKSQVEKAPPALTLASLRRACSEVLGSPALLRLTQSEEAVGFANWKPAAEVASRGTVTPDHVIHIKPKPLIIDSEPEAALAQYVQDYHSYFKRHESAGLKELDACPRWAIWPGVGCLSIGSSLKALQIIDDITTHTRRCLQWAEKIGGWRPVSEFDLFEVEYWELEQAKLKHSAQAKLALQGKIAVVSGAASGIGKAIALGLKAQGAAVAGLDRDAKGVEALNAIGLLGLICDVTSDTSVRAALEKVVQNFGGIDILVSNAGTFPAGKPFDEISEPDWAAVLDVNLSGHFRVMKAATSFLKLGHDPSIVVVGSKNVAAPGPGAAAYSTAKAGLTQLSRVAALELAPFGVRVNLVHPDAVFDTGIWSDEVIAGRAKHYGQTVEQYKRKNLLKTEITSIDVARLVTAMVGPAFAKTTGAQVPIDGGNDRVI